MSRLLALLVSAALVVNPVAATGAVVLPRAWLTIQPNEMIIPDDVQGRPRYLSWMADTIIKKGVAPTNAYTTSAAYSGILLAHNRTSDARYYDYVRYQVDVLLYPTQDGTIALYNGSLSLDDIRIGHSFLDMYESTGEGIYLAAAQLLRKQINETPRTPDGGFYHRYPTYVDQMWLDGIYMADVFYARWTALLEPDNFTAWDDIALQFDLINAGTTSDPATKGLPVHGFDASRTQVWADPETGAAPHVWGRAVGWYIMALVDTLDYFPSSHPGRERLLGYLGSLASAIVEAQHPTTKGWWLVMTPGYEGKWGNYIETSGTAMFVYGLLKSARLGYIKGERYLASALDAYALLTETLSIPSESDGGLNLQWTVQTGSLSSNGTFEYYASMPVFEDDLKGVAPFLFSSYEYELLKEEI
ncbi:cell wall glycosyl hydrolase YteR [Pseudomassariella vexata]|uniref:Cell wall glycosyl hydrolase YteR n=1 Tax=Pseudomassariella vexata TaxID=1141098 RepID=A0A1Y2DGJ8_9PEZI|nr:cell wall glycosyl hydrolase YteR [Pseudomassariella vexata]ORY58378.1 cell wall glycosyl hydrolase YteR [Pseudomassariella vexata]